MNRHGSASRPYVKFAPPKSLTPGTTPSVETMLDNETGEPLMQRADDTEVGRCSLTLL